jgi:hypothetical protein
MICKGGSASRTGIEGAGGKPDLERATAVLLLGKFGSLGVHSMLSIQWTFPDYFANLIFVSVAVHDSGTFRGTAEVGAQRQIRQVGIKATTLSEVTDCGGTDSCALCGQVCLPGDDGEEARRFTRARRGCGGMRTDPGAATGGGRPGSASAWGMS